MIRREFEDGMGEAIVTVQMTVNDYRILNDFIDHVSNLKKLDPEDLAPGAEFVSNWASEIKDIVY